MAKHSPTDSFLGGGPAFNQAGGAPPAGEDLGPDAARPGPRLNLRLLLVLILVLALAAVLISISGNGIPGVTQTPGKGGVSPADRPAAPPRNF